MARFEVFIPAADTAGFNVTFRVEADNWMAALKTGMQKLGEQGANVQNILVDIQDDESVHITESGSGRVFRIRELSEAEAAQTQPKRPTSSHPTPAAAAAAAAPRPPSPPPAPAPEPPPAPVAAPQAPARQPAPTPAAPAERVGAKTEPGMPVYRADPRATVPGAPLFPEHHEAQTIAGRPPMGHGSDAEKTIPGRPMAPVAVASADPHATVPGRPPLTPAVPAHTKPLTPSTAAANVTIPAPTSSPPRRRGKTSEATSVVELEAPARPVVGQIGRAPQTKNQKQEIEDLLAEVFERVQDVYSRPNEEAALYFLLDLALEKIPAESGTVFKADAATGDLTFRCVRGPKAEELLKAKMVLPAGTGVVGFCEVEGVSLALSDVQKDPRYYSAVAEKVNYTPKSVLCAPMMTHGRTFGCLQILNKRDNSTFNAVEVGLAAYIAHQAALYLNTR